MHMSGLARIIYSQHSGQGIQLASAACVFSVPLFSLQQTDVWTDRLYPIQVISCDVWSFAFAACLLHLP